MQSDWKVYQQQVAQFFTDLGLSATVEKEIQGARGKHKVDVFVTGRVHSFDLRWIIECKYWSSNIPKEKALALLSIVQDIGADKGILLSEIGFQSGAIRSSRNTNILLTSLADLKEEMRESFVETIISSLHWRLTKVSNALSALHRIKEKESRYTHPFAEKAKIMLLGMAFEDALAGEYPTIYAYGPNDTRLAANDFDELVREANKLIMAAEAFVDTYRPKKQNKSPHQIIGKPGS